MDIDERIEIIRSEPTEEIVTDQDLRTVLETKAHPKHYIGFEISGMLHIGHVLVVGKKINDLEKAGVQTQILIADWHTVANQKLGGDWERIKKAAEFYKRVFSFVCPNSKIILGSDLYHNNNEYWKDVMKISAKTTMARATRTLIIQGRSEKDTLHVSQYIYPMMQVADIKALDVDISHAGMDQRKVHMLAREVFGELHDKRPLALLHTHLLQSLLEPQKLNESATKEEIATAMKMSKSKPGSGINILAGKEDIKRIISGGWCPEGVTEGNPILGLCRYVIFPHLKTMKIERSSKYGGDIEFSSYRDLEEYFAGKKLHPADLKSAVASSMIKIISPISDRFSGEKEELGRLFAV
jgi:tyrosyl-tRNA synthetase